LLLKPGLGSFNKLDLLNKERSFFSRAFFLLFIVFIVRDFTNRVSKFILDNPIPLLLTLSLTRLTTRVSVSRSEISKLELGVPGLPKPGLINY
jgi:hypothetical protein